MIEPEMLRRVVRDALDEDIGAGDLTSRLVVADDTVALGRVVAREPLTVSGLTVAAEVFRQVDPSLAWKAACADGDERSAGEAIGTVRGRARAILAGERTALNFLQRMSGIATATRCAVAEARGTRAEIAATRKTAPGLRALDKEAVVQGGGVPHRHGLYDAVLIKDNHWRLAGGIAVAVARARAALEREGKSLPIEVEVGTPDEAAEAARAGAEAILLDNMNDAALRAALAAVRGRAFVEVSGGVRPEDITRLARLGVDRISLGWLTHSARASDIALEIEPA